MEITREREQSPASAKVADSKYDVSPEELAFAE